MNILVGITGSVATLKLPELIDAIMRHFPESHLKVVATERSLHFVHVESFTKKYPHIPLLRDANEWSCWQQRGDPVLHIELRKWADVLIVAPLDANTLAKVANGICDNLLSSVMRAWNAKEKPVLLSPAMNTAMWNHPVTIQHLSIVKSFGYRLMDPIEKTLVCGDHGVGAMAEVSSIVNWLLQTLSHGLQSDHAL